MYSRFHCSKGLKEVENATVIFGIFVNSVSKKIPLLNRDLIIIRRVRKPRLRTSRPITHYRFLHVRALYAFNS
ncbi:hypothetical protein L1887_28644 [Cichorium endivia]|nr:hypothetical protein L1887_28644 [Cichorium endivia]